MALNWNLNFLNGSSQNHEKLGLKAIAETTLGGGNLKLAVKLPEGEDVNEWLAAYTVDFVNHVNMLYGCLSEYCTRKTCPVMTAGSKYEFQWCDGVKFKKPTKMSAPEYVDHLITWGQKQIDDDSMFPTQVGVGFSNGFQDQVKTIFKRLFRIYAHIYHSHFNQIAALGVEAHLNTSFKHLVYFCKEFSLLDDKDYAPLQELVAQIMTQ